MKTKKPGQKILRVDLLGDYDVTLVYEIDILDMAVNFEYVSQNSALNKIKLNNGVSDYIKIKNEILKFNSKVPKPKPHNPPKKIYLN